MIYTVKSGDTLYKIAAMYGSTINDIVVANGLENPDSIIIGQNLIIPRNISSTYRVKAGDTMYKIAMRYSIPLQSLIQANPQIQNPNLINIGDTINIPDNRREIEVNGYAIANISDTTLTRTLPYLTYLSIFSYQVNSEGRLSNLYEESLINKALESSVTPLMVVTNIAETGGFNSDITSSILNSTEIQNRVITDIISILTAKRYAGINIDFEYIYPQDREKYNEFLRNLNTQMKAINPEYILTVAVAPKYRDEQSGILYEAHDYRSIGEIADRVIIMTYEWGYMYGEPMAVSPKNEMSAVLKYAVTRIPANKILMGLPNYAYDWTLPYTPGSSAEAISNTTTLNRAISYGVNIRFDEKSQTPYYEYRDANGREHIVWFDDARSYKSKLELVDTYGLAGISIWTINNDYPPLLSAINDRYIVKKVM